MNLAALAFGFVINIDPLAGYYAALQREYSEAVNTLLTCDYFLEYYPSRHFMLEQLVNYDPPRIEIFPFPDNEACAYAVARENTIYLFKNAFDDLGGCDTLASTIGHELLHLIRMPKHQVPVVPRTDEVYQVTHMCFGRDYPF